MIAIFVGGRADGRASIFIVLGLAMKVRKTVGWWLWMLPVALSLAVGSTQAKPEFAKKESKACTYCHVKLGAKELNERGMYYKDHGNSLEGYKETQAAK